MKIVAAAALTAALLAAAPARADGPNLSAVSSVASMDGVRLTFALAEAATQAEAQAEKTVFGLPKNIGTADRVVRGVLAAALVGFGAYGLSNDGAPSDGASAAMMGLALIPAATAATGYCPLYQALGIDTN